MGIPSIVIGVRGSGLAVEQVVVGDSKVGKLKASSEDIGVVGRRELKGMVVDGREIEHGNGGGEEGAEDL